MNADTTILYASLMLAAGMLSYYLANKPDQAFLFWLGSTVLVPFWIRLDVSVLALNPPVIAALICLPAAILAHKPRLNIADLALLAVLGVAVVGNLVFYAPDYALNQMLLQWTTAYLVGRCIGPAIGIDFVAKAISMFAVVVALWAIVEFAADWHVFQTVGTGEPEGFWADTQERSGYVRSEAAFGHPIALGGFLSASIPFIASVNSTVKIRVTALLIVALGTAATLSRAPLIAAIFGFVLVSVFLPAQRFGSRKASIVTTGALVAAVLAPVALSTLGKATDTESSSEYRVNLWAEIPGDTNLIGLGDNISVNALGNPTWRNLDSVDSMPLLVGLNFGWLVLVLLGTLTVAAIYRMLRSRASVAEIALVGQLPVLLTVALITQYTAMVWLLAGLAVAFKTNWKKVLGHTAAVHDRGWNQTGGDEFAQPGDAKARLAGLSFAERQIDESR